MLPFHKGVGMILILSVILFHIKEYNAEEAVDLDAIETPWTWITAIHWLPHFLPFTSAAKYFGSTIAGQAEFPWVVDVRCKDLDAEGWGIGNLISDLWVLTACSVIKDWEFVEECGGPSPTKQYVVYFCTNYINEDYTRYGKRNEEIYHLTMGHDDNGARLIVRIVKHPKCNTMKRINNFALLKLSNPIPVYVPVTGYMPLYGEPESTRMNVGLHFGDSVYPKLYHMDGDSLYYKKLVCYVASFGRASYNNVIIPQNEDYKVKYRAYFEHYDYCINENFKLYERLCYNNGNEPRNITDKRTINVTCVNALKRFGDSGITISRQLTKKPFMCFRTYAKHGAVCDVDRGAPLVCDGEVYGFVTRGVPWEYCVNTRMFPFIVIKADMLTHARLYRSPPLEPDFGYYPGGPLELVEPSYSYSEIVL